MKAGFICIEGFAGDDGDPEHAIVVSPASRHVRAEKVMFPWSNLKSVSDEQFCGCKPRKLTRVIYEITAGVDRQYLLEGHWTERILEAFAEMTGEAAEAEPF